MISLASLFHFPLFSGDVPVLLTTSTVNSVAGSGDK